MKRAEQNIECFTNQCRSNKYPRVVIIFKLNQRPAH